MKGGKLEMWQVMIASRYLEGQQKGKIKFPSKFIGLDSHVYPSFASPSTAVLKLGLAFNE